jgi:hypothetical protein
VWLYDRNIMKTVSYEIAWFQIVIPGLAGLLGVLVGGWITTRNQKIERQHQRIREQLSNSYSVLIGMHKQIREKSQVRVKLRGIANRAYQNELKQAGDDQIAAKRIADASEPAYEKIMEYDNQQLTEELVPLYRSMLDHLTKNMWLAEPSTLEHYPALVEYVELWNRGLKQTLPTEVMFEVEHEEKSKVVNLRSSISLREQYAMFSDNVTVVFTVEEWFSGQPQKTARLHITRFLGACGYEYRPGDLFFHKGERYLVYASENNSILSTNHCSKTRAAHDKDDAEIENLRRLHRLPFSIVTGTYVLPSVHGPNAPLVGASVTLTSPVGQRFTAKTDADGGFTFSGLPAATYQIQFDTPPGYVVDWNSGAFWFTSEGIVPANQRELVVSNNACRDASYTALPNGRISGVAASPRGKLPVPSRFASGPPITSTPSKIIGGPGTKPVPQVPFR